MWQNRVRFAIGIIVVLNLAAIAADEVTFTFVPPGAGAKKTVQSDQSSLWKRKITSEKGEVLENSRKYMLGSTNVQHTILDAEADVVKKIELKYGPAVISESESDIQAPPSPVFGKTYVAEFKGGVIEVTDAQGKTPSEKEIEIVRRESHQLGDPNYFARFLNGKHLKLKEKIELPKDILKDLSKDTDRWKYESMELTLVSIDTIAGRECAVLDTQIVMSARMSEDAVLKLESKGRAVLATDICRQISHQNVSTVTFKGATVFSGVKVDMDISATMQAREIVHYDNKQ